MTFTGNTKLWGTNSLYVIRVPKKNFRALRLSRALSKAFHAGGFECLSHRVPCPEVLEGHCARRSKKVASRATATGHSVP
jgi:hypothetical protein